jgi:lipoic acid synthetase
VFNHNMEVVESLYRTIQPQKNYARSLEVLRHAKAAAHITTKSGLMVGLGETRAELTQTLRDLRACGVDMLTVGQYLKPEPGLAEVARYYTPEEFAQIKAEAQALGFEKVASGPFVRSSYNAKEQFIGAA